MESWGECDAFKLLLSPHCSDKWWCWALKSRVTVLHLLLGTTRGPKHAGYLLFQSVFEHLSLKCCCQFHDEVQERRPSTYWSLDRLKRLGGQIADQQDLIYAPIMCPRQGKFSLEYQLLFLSMPRKKRASRDIASPRKLLKRPSGSYPSPRPQ